jgi:hypothetical protein
VSQLYLLDTAGSPPSHFLLWGWCRSRGSFADNRLVSCARYLPAVVAMKLAEGIFPPPDTVLFPFLGRDARGSLPVLHVIDNSATADQLNGSLKISRIY